MQQFQWLLCVEAIIYLLLYKLHECTFKERVFKNIQA